MQEQGTTQPRAIWIALTQGKATLIDAADWPLVSQYRWWAVKASTTGAFYAATKVATPDGGRRVVEMQRFLMGEPEGMLVDHRSRDTLDNRRENLRVATDSQNKTNAPRYRSNQSGYKGVYIRSDGRCTAQIRHNRHLYSLGSFSTPEEAARAYDAKARQLQGAFARCNFQD